MSQWLIANQVKKFGVYDLSSKCPECGEEMSEMWSQIDSEEYYQCQECGYDARGQQDKEL